MQQTKPSEIKALSIIHLALLLGQVFFTLISLFLIYSKNSSSSSSLQQYSQQLIILCIILGFAGYLVGKNLFRKKLEQINGNVKSVPEKFNDYRSACITRWALLEAPSLFSLILFFLTGNYIILVVGVAIILLFFTTRPSLQKVASDLGISETEIENIGGSSL